VDALKVRHVIVCGHYACGGVRAAIEGGATGALGTWLEHIRKIYVEQREALDLLSADERWDRMVELNTIAQVQRLRDAPVIQSAWARGQALSLHGWVYRVGGGVLHELVAIEAPLGNAAPLQVP